MYFLKNLKLINCCFLILLVSLSNSASAFTFEVSSIGREEAFDFNRGAGDLDIALEYDTSTELLDVDILFHNNEAGLSANFFFLVVTDGPSPGDFGANTQSVIFFDASREETVLSIYDYREFDGSSQRLIESAAGDLVYSSLNSDDPSPVTSLTSDQTEDDSRYTFSLDSSLVPGVSFGENIGFWIQYAGLDSENAFSTFSEYGEDGGLSELIADIGSPGSYGWFDLLNQVAEAGVVGSDTDMIDPGTIGDDTSEVPEPSTVLLLGLSALAIAFKRRRI